MPSPAVQAIRKLRVKALGHAPPRVEARDPESELQRVIEVSGPPVHERGPRIDDWSDLSRVAVMVHWSATPRGSKSVSEYSRQLVENGYRVAICSSSEVAEPLEWPHGLPDEVSVYRRPNIGYDFGTWASMLAAFPQLRESPRVILANDSLLGPFTSIAPVLQRFDEAECDVWGLVSNTQYAYHFQSYFVGYKDGALARPPLSDFWRDVALQPTKLELILKYEIGIYPVINGAGLRVAIGYPYDLVVNPNENPTIAGWRRLLVWGFPWVKRELILRRPVEAPDVFDVDAVVRQMFDQDVEEWL